MLRTPRWSQHREGQSAVQHPANANTVPQLRNWELPAASEAHRSSRSEPPSPDLPSTSPTKSTRGSSEEERWSTEVFYLLSLYRGFTRDRPPTRTTWPNLTRFMNFSDICRYLDVDVIKQPFSSVLLLNLVHNVQFSHWYLNVLRWIDKAFILICLKERTAGWRSISHNNVGNSLDFERMGLFIDNKLSNSSCMCMALDVSWLLRTASPCWVNSIYF